MEAPTAIHLVQKYNAIAVSVRYRLAPEHVFPTQINDCWDSLQWVTPTPPHHPLPSPQIY